MLRLIKSRDIDNNLWNDVINQSENAVIYALSYFLDHTKYSWEAIVDFDNSLKNPYKSVMPLVVGKKYGLTYLAYEPWFSMLGIFSQRNVDKSLVENMLGMVRRSYVKVNQYPFEPSISDIVSPSVQLRHLSATYLNCFDLTISHAELKKMYNRNRMRALRAAKSHGLIFKETDDIDLHIRLFRECTLPNVSDMQPSQLDQLVNIYRALAERGLAKIYEVQKGEETLSSGMFFFLKQTITYFTTTNNHFGRKINSQSFLIDSIFEAHAGSDWVLEAYSGAHEGIGSFYRSLGAKQKVVRVWKDQRLLLQNALKR